jgi:hypothetical protein
MTKILPQGPDLPLSQALAWIAFGDITNSEFHWDDYAGGKAALEAAVEAFVTSASCGKIPTLGKLVSNLDTIDLKDQPIVNTEPIPNQRFHDYRQYDQKYCGFRRGRGLFGFADEQDGCFIYEVPHLIKEDQFYRDVVVDRDALLKEFPSKLAGASVPFEDVVAWCRGWIANGKGNDNNKAWHAFSKLPEFEGCSRDEVFRNAWKEVKTKQ